MKESSCPLEKVDTPKRQYKKRKSEVKKEELEEEEEEETPVKQDRQESPAPSLPSPPAVFKVPEPIDDRSELE